MVFNQVFNETTNYTMTLLSTTRWCWSIEEIRTKRRTIETTGKRKSTVILDGTYVIVAFQMKHQTDAEARFVRDGQQRDECVLAPTADVIVGSGDGVKAPEHIP